MGLFIYEDTGTARPFLVLETVDGHDYCLEDFEKRHEAEQWVRDTVADNAQAERDAQRHRDAIDFVCGYWN